jgi:hypothetical protein
VQIGDRYAPRLIDLTQPNFRRSLLVARMNNQWYNLSPTLQDQVANDLLARSQQLDFSQLELQDATGNLLARNPVVGARMVVLQRKANTALVAPGLGAS